MRTALVNAMSSQQPYVTTSDGKRQFACSPVAVLVFIINEEEKVLLLAHPKRRGAWEVVNGALEAGETVLACALREAGEEAGPQVRLRPLGVLHAATFYFDPSVQYMISLCYVMAYEGGPIQPGDDMAGSAFRWWSVAELADESARLIVPPDQKWLVRRAIEVYRLWKDEQVVLQREIRLEDGNKYTLQEKG